MSTQNEFSYDFCLSGDLNEKLVTAVNLLDEVRKTRTLQIKQAIRGLDQAPIV